LGYCLAETENFMNHFLSMPAIGMFVTLFFYFLALGAYQRWKWVFLNPVLVASVCIIALLQLSGVPFEAYNRGGQWVSFFLGPSVVALGVLFYEQLPHIKKQLPSFLLAVCTGGFLSMVSVLVISLLLYAEGVVVRSLVTKSVTSPIAIEVTTLLGGIPELAAGVVIAVGILGNALGPAFLRWAGIRQEAAIGTALGTAAHGIGTARAVEMGPLPGAFSGLAMVANGFFTALAAPYLTEWAFRWWLG
jgi:predicted murein hydrolase (TIGR00659 family)